MGAIDLERLPQALHDLCASGGHFVVGFFEQDGEFVTPMRPISAAGMISFIRWATSEMSLSPVACPKVSLTALNRSRSMNSTQWLWFWEAAPSRAVSPLLK
ncbi:hypothetical protein ACOJBM_40480 [Rhizobium beringeri]